MPASDLAKESPKPAEYKVSFGSPPIEPERPPRADLIKLTNTDGTSWEIRPQRTKIGGFFGVEREYKDKQGRVTRTVHKWFNQDRDTGIPYSHPHQTYEEVFDPQTGRMVEAIMHTYEVWLPGGGQLVVFPKDRHTNKFDPISGRKIREEYAHYWDRKHPEVITKIVSLEYHPESGVLILRREDDIDAETGKVVRTEEHIYDPIGSDKKLATRNIRTFSKDTGTIESYRSISFDPEYECPTSETHEKYSSSGQIELRVEEHFDMEKEVGDRQRQRPPESTEGGHVIYRLEEIYDPESGKIKIRIIFHFDPTTYELSKTSLERYDFTTGNRTSRAESILDSKTGIVTSRVKRNYDPRTGEQISVLEQQFDPVTGQEISRTGKLPAKP